MVKRFTILAGCILIAGAGTFGWVRMVYGQKLPPVTNQLKGKDQFQAEQWLRLAKDFASLGDYPSVDHYCRLLIEYYPNTYYANEAEGILKKISSVKKNRGRQRIKNNPGLFPQ